jgi:hypothetical protein
MTIANMPYMPSQEFEMMRRATGLMTEATMNTYMATAKDLTEELLEEGFAPADILQILHNLLLINICDSIKR